MPVAAVLEDWARLGSQFSKVSLSVGTLASTAVQDAAICFTETLLRFLAP